MDSYIGYLRQLFREQWQTVLASGVLFTVVGGACLLHLRTLLPGYSAQEYTTYDLSGSFRAIWEQPLDAPFKVMVHGLRFLAPHDFVVVRLVSVAIALVMLFSFYLLMVRWHGIRAAVMGTLLFGLSASLLHVARLGVPASMFLGLFPLVTCGIWLRERQSGLAASLGLALCAILLYTPGMVWFLLVGLIFQWSTINSVFKKHPGAVWLGSALFIGLLVPLGWHLYKHVADLHIWLAMPQDWSHVGQIIHSIVTVPIAIFFRHDTANPLMYVGRLPLLGVFSTVMFAAGCAVYGKRLGMARVRVFLLLGIAGMLIVGLSQGRIPVTPLLPFIFAVVAAGLGNVVDRWYVVFPRNPIAQSLGLGLAGLVLATALFYNVQNYFIAWPQATVTRELFIQKEP